MAVITMTKLPRAMLIDMDDTILSAYSRPDLAWNIIATEFAGELAPLSPQQVAAAIVEFGTKILGDGRGRVAAEARGGPARGGPGRI